MILPMFYDGDLLEELEKSEDFGVAPYKTYNLDFEDNKITHPINGDEAIRQFIKKTIITNRSHYMIYSDDYGCDIYTLLGTSVSDEYLEMEVPRFVTEALIYDDRISDVFDFTIKREGSSLYVDFKVELYNNDILEIGVTL